MSNCVIYGQNLLKLDKIGHISVRDFASACINIFIINFAFFDFFNENFRIKTKLLPYSTMGIVSRKNLAAKFFVRPK